MAYKKDIRPWLKENGLTWEQMDKIWEEVCEVNWKCKLIKNSGKSWNDMTMYQIEQLPNLKEITLKQLEEKELAKKRDEENKKKAEEYKAYYYSHFEELMVEKIDEDEELTKEELQKCLLRYEIERENGDNRRWFRSVTSILSMCDRFFSLSWEEGLTEYQPNEFFNQPFEVEKHEYEKVIKVVEWKKK